MLYPHFPQPIHLNIFPYLELKISLIEQQLRNERDSSGMLGTAVGHASGGQLLAAVRAVEPTIIQGLEYPVGVPLEIDMVEPEKEAEPVPVRILNMFIRVFFVV